MPLAVLLLLALGPTAALAQAAPTLHALSGTVVDAGTGAPLPYAEVALLAPGPEGNAATAPAPAAPAPATHTALTDANGRFELPAIPYGEWTLEATRLGYAPTRVGVTVPTEAPVRVALTPAPVPLSEIVVTPGHYGALAQPLATRTAMTRERIESRPQLGEDIFRSVVRVPGVTASDLSAAFGIRGSRPSEVLVVLDGLELYEPFHLKDFDNALSILDLSAMGSVDLMTGGFGAQHGDRLGGVFDVRSLAVEPGAARTQVGASITAVRASSRGSFADGRGRWLASARRGFLELALKLASDDEGEFGAPTYHDLFGKVEYGLGPGVLSANLLYAHDALDYESRGNDPHVSSRYSSGYAWLTWRSPVAGPLSLTATAAAGRLTWNRFTAEGPGRRAVPLDVQDRRGFRFLSLRQDWMAEWSGRTLSRAGLHVRGLSADYDYRGWRLRDSAEDGALVQSADITLVEMDPRGLAVDAWALQRLRLTDAVVAEAGVHYSRREHSDDEIWSPRLNVSVSPLAATTVRASWGHHAQAHGIHELSVVDGESAFQPAERSEQLGLGVEQAIPRWGVSLRAEAYDRRLTDLRPRWVNLDSADDLFAELARTRARIDPTDGRSRGVELSVERQVARGWSGGASYVLSEVTETVGGREVPRARDQRHAVSLDAVWAPNEKWSLAAAWHYHSGWPRTAHDYWVELLDNGRPFVHWLYDDYNADRLPAYHRLDGRITRRWHTARGHDVTLYLDVFNVYDRTNARAIVLYAPMNSRGTIYRRERTEKLLPRLPSVGFMWEF